MCCVPCSIEYLVEIYLYCMGSLSGTSSCEKKNNVGWSLCMKSMFVQDQSWFVQLTLLDTQQNPAPINLAFPSSAPSVAASSCSYDLEALEPHVVDARIFEHAIKHNQVC